MLTPESGQVAPANPYGHPFVRFVKRGDAGFYVESCVYNVKTGERRLCWPVDAKEMVATGGWSFEPVTPASSEPEMFNPPAPEPEPAMAGEPGGATEYRRGPGRPRKTAA